MVHSTGGLVHPLDGVAMKNATRFRIPQFPIGAKMRIINLALHFLETPRNLEKTRIPSALPLSRVAPSAICHFAHLLSKQGDVFPEGLTDSAG